MDIQPNNNNNTRTNNNTNNKNISIAVLYIHGLGEKFKRTCNNKGIQVHFKGTNTLKHFSWHQMTGTTNSKEWGNLQIQIPTHKLP